MTTWMCPVCGRSYPDNGKSIRCICTNGRGEVIREIGAMPCKHRGQVVGKCKLGCCGFTKIYECKMGGECIIKPVAKMSEEVKEGRVFCSECEFREES